MGLSFPSIRPSQICSPASSCRYRRPLRHHSSPPRHHRQQISLHHLATASMRPERLLGPVGLLAQILAPNHIADPPYRAHGPLLRRQNRPHQSLQSRNLRRLARSVGYISTTDNQVWQRILCLPRHSLRTFGCLPLAATCNK